MTKVYGSSSGEYSSYSVGCLFAREEDCREYVISQNRAWAKSSHGHHHKGDFESCRDWPCKSVRESPDQFEYRVEAFDFYPAGVVPVVTE